jgi:transcriptional regulator with XRE-family HTH domain
MDENIIQNTIKLIGDRIRAVRQERKLNQENAAVDLGISLTAYSKIERGLTHVSVARLLQIAEYFGVTLAQLILDKEALKPPVYAYDPASVSALQLKVQKLQQEIEQLRKVIADKEMIIELLNDRLERSECKQRRGFIFRKSG